MKLSLSLRSHIILAFISLGLVIVVGYSFLTAEYYVRGMDNIVAANMEKAAYRFVENVDPAKYSQANAYDNHIISTNWAQMPDDILAAFKKAPEKTGEFYKYDGAGFLSPPDKIHFVMRFAINDIDLFVGQTFSRENAPRVVGQNVHRSMSLLTTISITSAIAMAFIVWLVIKRVSRPGNQLARWARSLGRETLEDPIPDFDYPELNQLARLIQSSLSSTHDSLEREHRFLRHASHELRTPISVIRNNVELIDKLYQRQPEAINTLEKQAYERIDRASLTMKHLTETLLWLSRDDIESLPKQTFDLHAMLNALIEEMRYLLADKPVTISIDCETKTVELPEVALRIILGNLIRNAFQHTCNGSVTIALSNDTVTITNQNEFESNEEDKGDTGFGLGLDLTEMLTQKLKLFYTNEIIDGGRKVTLKV